MRRATGQRRKSRSPRQLLWGWPAGARGDHGQRPATLRSSAPARSGPPTPVGPASSHQDSGGGRGVRETRRERHGRGHQTQVLTGEPRPEPRRPPARAPSRPGPRARASPCPPACRRTSGHSSNTWPCPTTYQPPAGGEPAPGTPRRSLLSAPAGKKFCFQVGGPAPLASPPAQNPPSSAAGPLSPLASP